MAPANRPSAGMVETDQLLVAMAATDQLSVAIEPADQPSVAMAATDQPFLAMAATDLLFTTLNLAVTVVNLAQDIKEGPDRPSDSAAASMVAQEEDGEQD